MGKYVVSGTYATWAGNCAHVRRIVEAEDGAEALEIVWARVKRFKRYMGKLDLEAARIC